MNAAKPLPHDMPPSGVHWPHLSPLAKAVMDGPDELRITFLQEPRWIGYPRAVATLKDLESLLNHPRVYRPPCRLILGATNNGKTALLRRFESIHPQAEREDGEATQIPVLYAIAPPKPNEKRFYESILRRMKAPFNATDSVSRRHQQVLRVASEVRLGMLVIDEIHHVLAGGSAQHREFLNILKSLSGELQIPIVCEGTKSAFHAMQTDPEVGNRFQALPLPPWVMGTEYLSLLASFERILPLRLPSNLLEEALAIRILAMTEGRIGEMVTLLAKAAELAITSKQERIDGQVLNAAGFVPPQQRKELPDGLD